MESDFGPEHPVLLKILLRLAGFALEEGESEKYIALKERMIAIRRRDRIIDFAFHQKLVQALRRRRRKLAKG